MIGGIRPQIVEIKKKRIVHPGLGGEGGKGKARRRGRLLFSTKVSVSIYSFLTTMVCQPKNVEHTPKMPLSRDLKAHRKKETQAVGKSKRQTLRIEESGNICRWRHTLSTAQPEKEERKKK